MLQQLLDLDRDRDEHPPGTLVLAAVLPSLSSPATQQIKTSFPPAIDLSHCLHRPESEEAAASYVIRSGATGSRTIVNYNALREMTSGEFEGVVEGLGGKGMGMGMGWCHFEAS